MSPSLLDLLRSFSSVDCDTLNIEVAEQLGPFVDCTSNQAIALDELTTYKSDGTLTYSRLISEAVDYARCSSELFPATTIVELAVEAAMVKLAQRMTPHLIGFSHLQTNPKYAWDTQMTFQNAKRLVRIWEDLDPTLGRKRLCIKIAATREGIQACKELEKQGITCLATAVSSFQQAMLASAAGCKYIGCYVNDINVQADQSLLYDSPTLRFPSLIQQSFRKAKSRTRIISANVSSIDEAMMLAGTHHITISPFVLRELATTPVDVWKGDVGFFAKSVSEEEHITEELELEKSSWHMAFVREGGGQSESRLSEALAFFRLKQQALENMVQKQLHRHLMYSPIYESCILNVLLVLSVAAPEDGSCFFLGAPSGVEN